MEIRIEGAVECRTAEFNQLLVALADEIFCDDPLILNLNVHVERSPASIIGGDWTLTLTIRHMKSRLIELQTRARKPLAASRRAMKKGYKPMQKQYRRGEYRIAESEFA